MDTTGNTEDGNREQVPDIAGELKRILNKKIRNNRSVFVLLVSFAVVFSVWFLKQVQNGYVISAQIMPVYVNTPPGYTSQELSSRTVAVTVDMDGFNMLSYMLGKRRAEIDVNKVVEQAHGRHFWIPSKYPSMLSAAILSSDKLKTVSSDTIFLNMGDEVVKKVPVELSDMKTEYRPGYGTFEKVRIIPSQVKIIGTPEEVSAVDAVQLPPLSYRGLSAPVEDTVALPLPDGLRHARIEPERVVVAFSVKPYTEGEMTLAIRAVNVPRGYKVKFFPSKVKVRYRVSVDDYPRLSESDFSITADMSHTDPSSRIIYPKAVSFAPFVGQVTIMPERVEYLYRKE